jgi:hypothetical protein
MDSVFFQNVRKHYISIYLMYAFLQLAGSKPKTEGVCRGINLKVLELNLRENGQLHEAVLHKGI